VQLVAVLEAPGAPELLEIRAAAPGAPRVGAGPVDELLAALATKRCARAAAGASWSPLIARIPAGSWTLESGGKLKRRRPRKVEKP